MIPAAEWLTKLQFRANSDRDTYPASIYTCPHCGERVGLTLWDLDRHAHSDVSNLCETHARAVAALAADSLDQYNLFLNFYCPAVGHPSVSTTAPGQEVAGPADMI